MMPPSPDGKATRKSIPRRLRFEILRRDNYTCHYCRATDNPLTIDHVVPDALGGSDDPGNLVAACRDCNAGKSSSAPDAALVAKVSDDAIRWAEAMKFAAERLAANKTAVEESLKPWFDEWYVRSGPGWSYKLPADASDVLSQYLAAGMPIDVLVHAARVALRKRDVEDYFRYFRGVANNMLRDLQRDAMAILAQPAGDDALDYECSACHYRHPKNECGFRTGWRIGYVDCSLTGSDIEAAHTGHPDHFVMQALSLVVDRPAHEWAKSWPYPSTLYSTYTGI